MQRFILWCAFALSLLAVPVAAAVAQEKYPVRPVRLITPYAPGGSSTIVSRIVGAYLTELWGHSVIIDNRPGGNTIIGTQLGARANPDGYTLMFENTTFALNHLLIRRLPYDSLKDFTPLANIYDNETILAVNPSVPAKTLKEFIAYLKTRPGEVNHGSGGVGGISELRTAMFRLYTGTDFQNIAYKGSGPALTELLGGQVPVMFDQLSASIGYIRDGRLTALAVASASRSSVLPSVPTLDESGLKGYEATTFIGLVAPGATPKAVVSTLNAAVRKVMDTASVTERFRALGTDPGASSPEEFSKTIRVELAKWRELAQRAGLKFE